ncbi:MAG: NAD(P)-dependent alcohol dehydrogenase, partial [Acidobacteriota bacterium]
MKAVAYNKYGAPDVLEITEKNKPELPADKILVKVKASSVNPVDYKIRRGDMKALTGKIFPKLAGSDFAGVVEDKGSAVEDFRKGDKVYGFMNPMKGGAYAEFIIVDPEKTALMPDNLSFEEAASMPVAALTALQALSYLGNVKEGTSVLINGATGGVGSFAVQIAKALGAEVTGLCSGKNMEFCKKLGADNVFDYSKDGLAGSGKKFDVFFDAAAKTNFSKSKMYLKKRGIYITTIPTFN